MNYIYSKELYHHGIKGQKWGVRRWQNTDGSLTPEGYPHYGYNGPRSKGKQKDRNYLDDDDIVLVERMADEMNKSKNYNSTKEFRDLTSKKYIDKESSHTTRDLLIASGASIATGAGALALGDIVDGPFFIAAGVAAAGYAVKNMIADKKEKKYLEEREKHGKLDPKTGLYLKNKEMSIEEDLSKVNPAYGNIAASGAHNNCANCSVAYDVRRRGYDVTSEVNLVGATDEDIQSLYKNPEVKNIGFEKDSKLRMTSSEKKQFINDTKTAILDQPVGARGILTVNWGGFEGSSGHAMAYERSENGIRILDGQVNRILEGRKVDKLFETFGSSATVMRTDNAEIDIDRAKEMRFIR